MVGDGAAPALAGALALAGPQAAGVFLPGDGKAGAAGRADRRDVDVAPAGGDALGLEPDDVAEFDAIGLITGACSLTCATFKWFTFCGA